MTNKADINYLNLQKEVLIVANAVVKINTWRFNICWNSIYCRIYQRSRWYFRHENAVAENCFSHLRNLRR